MGQAMHASGPGADRADVLEQVGGVLLTQQTIDELLQLIVTSAGSYLVETYGASVTVRRETRLETPNASSPEVRGLDRFQYAANEGPSVAATATGEEVNVGLDTVLARWPAIGEAMQRRDLGGVVSTPLFAHGRTLGTLNVYLDTAGPAEEPLVGLARGYARQASALLWRAFDLESSHGDHGALVHALETRDIVGQATGILMASRGVTSQGAFTILRNASRRGNVKLRDLAQQLIDRHEEHARRP